MFWVFQTKKQKKNTVEKLNKHGSAKSITMCDFSTLYTQFSHYKLISVLNSVIDFPFTHWSPTNANL